MSRAQQLATAARFILRGLPDWGAVERVAFALGDAAERESDKSAKRAMQTLSSRLHEMHDEAVK